MQHLNGDQLPSSVPTDPQATEDGPAGPETRGCLFALSQPPLMFFLAFIGALFLLTAVHDLFLL